jgi:hypothetical protein
MRAHALFSRAFQARIAHPTNILKFQEPVQLGSWVVFTAAASAAVALVISAAAQNIAHSYNLGLATSEFRALVLALASAGASVLGPCAWLAVARGRGFGTRTIALVMAIGCLLFAGLCSLGFTAGSRDQAVVKSTAAADSYADKRAVAKAAAAELATLATIKTPTKVGVDRRRELAKLLSESSAGKGAVAAQVGHDSQATAIAAYFTAAGYPVTAEVAGRWINFGTVAFLELAASWSLTIAAALRPIRHQKPVGAPTAPALPAEPELPTEPASETRRRCRGHDDGDPPASAKARNKGGRPATVVPSEALARLRAKGGKIDGTLGSIGRLIGTRSRTTTHRLLHQLASAGLLSMTTTPRGIAVALV